MTTTIPLLDRKKVLLLSGSVWGMHLNILENLVRLSKTVDFTLVITTWDYDWNKDAFKAFLKDYNQLPEEDKFPFEYKLFSYEDQLLTLCKDFLKSYNISDTNNIGEVIFKRLVTLIVHKLSFEFVHELFGDEALVIRTRPIWEWSIKKDVPVWLEIFSNMNMVYDRKSKLKDIDKDNWLMSLSLTSFSLNDSQYMCLVKTGVKLFSSFNYENFLQKVIRIFKEEGTKETYDSQHELEDDIGPFSDIISFDAGWIIKQWADDEKIYITDDFSFIFRSLGKHSYNTNWPSLCFKNGKLDTRKARYPSVRAEFEVPIYKHYLLT